MSNDDDMSPARFWVDAPVRRRRLKVGMVMTITRRWTVLGKLKHYLFECPTFWRRKPAFQCPHCGKKYRCYWDGNDCGGKINVCHKCADDYERLGTWNETPNAKVSGAGTAFVGMKGYASGGENE